jgi:hypothetical protein
MWTYCMLTYLSCLFLVVHPLLDNFDVISFLFLDEGEFSLRGLCPNIVTW